MSEIAVGLLIAVLITLPPIAAGIVLERITRQ